MYPTLPQTLHYQLDFSRYHEHIAEVSLTFTAHTDNPTVWLPTWIAGSYLIREFARNITVLTANIGDKTDEKGDNRVERCQKIDKNHWQITAQTGEKITLHYEVYAYDLSVRTAYFDQTRLYGNFTSLAVAVAGLESCPILVELICPNAFFDNAYHDGNEVSLTTALPEKMHQQREQTIYQLRADNYEHLTDSPFEIAVQDSFDFDVIVKKNNEETSIPHRFFVSGQHHSDLERLHYDLSKICQTYVNWLGDTPFADYTFMTLATGSEYGGLEHLSSTSLVTPRDDLPTFAEQKEPSEAYQTFLGLCSHEYFHAWWVKTVRPDVMLNADLNQLFSHEAPSPLLWVFEGFTSYIDDFMLQKSGVISQDSYLKLLNIQINRYYQTQGRALQTVAESSYDAWLKLYRNDENTANAGISYYNKGALVALCLDLTLKQFGKRLFDIVKIFYQMAKNQPKQRFGMNNENLDSVIKTLMPTDVWQDFRANYIDGTTELPLFELLNREGVHVKRQSDLVIWGIKTVNDPMGLKIQRVIRNSQASHAGLSAHDVIVAMNGIKASEKQLKHLQKLQTITGEPIVCHVFRRDELLVLTVNPSDKSQFVQPENWHLSAQKSLEFLHF